MQKKLIRIIFGSPYRAHTEPLFDANKILIIKDINFYVVYVFMYNCVSSSLPGFFYRLLCSQNEFDRHGTRNANDWHVSFAKMDSAKYNTRINGINSRNGFPNVLKQSSSISSFKYRFGNYIMSLKCCDENSQT